MKHLEKVSRLKQKKPTSSPQGRIGKIITLSLIGTGVYLLLSRRKVFAEEVPLEEFSPVERSQDLFNSLLQQLKLAPIQEITAKTHEEIQKIQQIADEKVETARMEAEQKVKKAQEEADKKTLSVTEETDRKITEILKKATDQLEILKRQAEAATQLKLEDLVAEYRQRDEIVRMEADQKVAATRMEADQKVAAARAEAETMVAAARAEAERMVAAARAEAERMVAAARAETEIKIQTAIPSEPPPPKQIWKGWIDQGHLMAIDDEGYYRDCSWAWVGHHGDCYRNWKVDFIDNVIEGKSCEEYPAGTVGRGFLRNACAYQNQTCYKGYFVCTKI